MFKKYDPLLKIKQYKVVSPPQLATYIVKYFIYIYTSIMIVIWYIIIYLMGAIVMYNKLFYF